MIMGGKTRQQLINSAVRTVVAERRAAPAPTMARSYGGSVWHYLNRGAATPRTMCGRDAARMARFNPADLQSGERTVAICERCR